MYAGSIVESGTTEDILTAPYHPYTKGLLEAVPRLEDSTDEDLVPIDGVPPSLAGLPDYCAFYPRCASASEFCKQAGVPKLIRVGERDHFAACPQQFSEVGR